ncbi:fibronectin type-III domain-containing protein 3A-like [Oscarella lobularis]|uniref:fibronectin type-III domain-containing protein 3A-like n=1 Tax=Oscarella lobularis TaxID=121494 RepID=UPI003313FE16
MSSEHRVEISEATLRELVAAASEAGTSIVIRDQLGRPISVRCRAVKREDPPPPSPPREPQIINVEVGDTTSRSASISWSLDEAKGKVVYELFVGNEKKDTTKLKSVYKGNGLAYKLDQLTPGKEYFIRVRAYDESKEDSPTESLYGESKVVTVKTLSEVPDKPSQLRLASRTKNSITVKWNAPYHNGSDISAYHLYWDQGREDEEFVLTYSGSQKQHKLIKLAQGHAYRFKVCAENALGKSEMSEIERFATQTGPPAAPSEPHLISSTPRSLTIGWNSTQSSSSDVESLQYTLEMEDSATGYGFRSVYHGSDDQFTSTDLTSYTEYSFRVSVSNSSGTSKFSSVAHIRTSPDKPGPPSAPQLVGSSQSTSLTVSWGPPKADGGLPVSNYLVEISRQKDTGFTDVYNGSFNQCTIKDLAPGTRYWCRVSASSAGGVGPFSTASSISTRPVVPGSPQNLRLNKTAKADSLPIAWESPDATGGSPITDYLLQMKSDKDFVDVYSGPVSSFFVRNLSPGKSYAFRVKAKNAVGFGSWSNEFVTETSASVPGKPLPPTYQCKSPHRIHLEWKAPCDNGSPVTSYRLALIHEVEECVYSGPDLACDVKQLKPATYYYFRLQASNTVGQSPWSDLVTIVTPPGPPSAVQSLQTRHSTVDSIGIEWKDPLNNGSPILRYDVDVIGVDVFQTEEKCFSVPNLHPETTYKIRIRAINEIGAGGYSKILQATTGTAPPSAPHPPDLVKATYNSLKIKWENPEKLEHILQMKSAGNNKFQTVHSGLVASHRVNRLQVNSPYSFRLASVNSGGQSEWSEAITYRTTQSPPPAPIGLTCANVTSETAHIAWKPSPQAADLPHYVYELQMQKIGFGSDFDQLFRGDATEFWLSTLQSDTAYRLRVRVSVEIDSSVLYSPFSTLLSFQTKPVEKKDSVPVKKRAVDTENHSTQEQAPIDDPMSNFNKIAIAVMVAVIVIAILLGYLMT